MILTEQYLKAHKQIYYHSQASWFLEEERIYKDVFYITTYLPYAITYTNRRGKVFSYTLRQNANIFNAKSSKDFESISNVLKDTELSQYLDRLSTDDWVFEDDFFAQDTKKKLINIIKGLGYDGFFNYEISKSFLEHMKKLKTPINEVMLNNPSIGIFNKDILLPIDECNRNDFLKNKDWIDYKKKEESYVCYRALSLIQQNLWNNKEKQSLLEELSTTLIALSNTEITEIINGINEETLVNNAKYYMERFHYLKESLNNKRPFVRTSTVLCFELHQDLLVKKFLEENH